MKDLEKEQKQVLATPRMNYGFLSKSLFVFMDLIYGRKKTLSKFKVLEIIARVPYQAWESVAYVAITHTHSVPNFAQRIFDFVKESRLQQDNEQWHLLILEELIHKKNIRENFLKYRLLPQIIALSYYHISWILYVIKPSLSYQMNAEFEDHAEHEYMEFVNEHPELDKESYAGDFTKEYGSFDTLSDLFRQIGLDEQHHKEESLDRIKHPRF